MPIQLIIGEGKMVKSLNPRTPTCDLTEKSQIAMYFFFILEGWSVIQVWKFDYYFKVVSDKKWAYLEVFGANQISIHIQEDKKSSYYWTNPNKNGNCERKAKHFLWEAQLMY